MHALTTYKINTGESFLKTFNSIELKSAYDASLLKENRLSYQKIRQIFDNCSYDCGFLDVLDGNAFVAVMRCVSANRMYTNNVECTAVAALESIKAIFMYYFPNSNDIEALSVNLKDLSEDDQKSIKFVEDWKSKNPKKSNPIINETEKILLEKIYNGRFQLLWNDAKKIDAPEVIEEELEKFTLVWFNAKCKILPKLKKLSLSEGKCHPKVLLAIQTLLHNDSEDLVADCENGKKSTKITFSNSEDAESLIDIISSEKSFKNVVLEKATITFSQNCAVLAVKLVSVVKRVKSNLD